MQKTISIKVSGIVQGVYYRQSTKAKAVEIGVSGEVKNDPDGTVTIVATGTDDQLKSFIKWCQKGPETAVVGDLKIDEIDFKEFTDFKIRR